MVTKVYLVGLKTIKSKDNNEKYFYIARLLLLNDTRQAFLDCFVNKDIYEKLLSEFIDGIFELDVNNLKVNIDFQNTAIVEYDFTQYL